MFLGRADERQSRPCNDRTADIGNAHRNWQARTQQERATIPCSSERFLPQQFPGVEINRAHQTIRWLGAWGDQRRKKWGNRCRIGSAGLGNRSGNIFETRFGDWLQPHTVGLFSWNQLVIVDDMAGIHKGYSPFRIDRYAAPIVAAQSSRPHDRRTVCF